MTNKDKEKLKKEAQSTAEAPSSKEDTAKTKPSDKANSSVDNFHEKMAKLAVTDLDTKHQTEEEAPTATPVTEEKKTWSKKKLFIVLGSIMVFLACSLSFYIGYTVNHANQLLQNSYAELPNEQNSGDDTKVEKIHKPISVLIMGIDNTKERHLTSTRTDSLIVCTYNPDNGDVSMVSIPRDTYVTMKQEHYNTTGKINSAYAIAQEQGTITAVEQLLDIPIDYYVRVDFDTLQDVVNAFGGVYVNVPFNLTEQNAQGKKTVHFHKGKHQLLNGEEALAFARTRHIDNDIERGKRQQEVLCALVDRAMEGGSVTKYAKVLQSLNGHIKTNMPKPVILGIASEALQTGIHITNYAFDWSGFTYNGESFVALKKDSLQFIRHRLQVQLGLADKDKRDEKGYKFKTNGKNDPSTYPPYDVTWG